MSRTYRRKDPKYREYAKENINHIVWGQYQDEEDLELIGRDRKDPYKPNKTFKYFRKRVRKAKEKQAFREGKEIPVFRNNDVWDWN